MEKYDTNLAFSLAEVIESISVKHLIFLTYILIFSTGFAALSALIVISVRVAGPFPKRMIILQSLFIVNLGLVALYYYLEQVLDLIGPSSSLSTGFSLVAFVLNIALYGSILNLLGVGELKRSKPHTLAFWGCIVTMALMLLSLLAHLLHRSFPLSLFSLAVYFSVSFTMTCLGLTLIKAPLSHTHVSYRLLVQGIGWCSLGFVPLSIVEYLIVLSGNKTYYPLSLEYLFYLGCNVVIVIAAAKSLERDPSSLGVFGEYTEEQGKRYSLTRRETEMANLIAQGKTNKEIASSLGISEATVRTHIYNLYQKVGASGRIELLNMLHD